MKFNFIKLKLCFCVLLFSTLTMPLLHAQYENVWVFGGNANVETGFTFDFNGGNPALSFTKLSSAGEAAASICDTKGKLLFYTEGDTVWNRNGQVMPNGSGLTGLPNFGGVITATSSSSQGALIVPMLGNPDKYYIFSLTDISAKHFMAIPGHLYYSIVDMTLNAGMGDIVAGQKGIFIDSGFAESVTGVAGDDCNIWIVAPAFSPATKKSDLFKVYEITKSGFNQNPTIFNVGFGVFPQFLSLSNIADEFSNIKFSPNRKRMARSRFATPENNRLELYDFDPATGTISNRLNLDSLSSMLYFSTCFSPDNSKLYATSYTHNRLYQFDLSVYTVSAINNSKTLIDNRIDTGGCDIKSGPDSKLYYFNRDSTIIKRINYPDRAGIACQPENATSALYGVKTSKMFSNVVPIPRADTSYIVTNSTICSTEDGIIQPHDTNSFWFFWDDGSTNRIRSISEPGTYWVLYGNYCHYRMDTFIIQKSDFPPPVINIKVFDLGITASYTTYQWLLDGQLIRDATYSTYSVKQNGNYTVIVTNAQGCIDTSDIYRVTNYTGIGDLSTLAQNINVYPNPVQDLLYINAPIKINLSVVGIEGRLIKEKQEAHSISLADIPDGIYLLRITDVEGKLIKVMKIVKSKK